jgi:hypothetical protein
MKKLIKKNDYVTTLDQYRLKVDDKYLVESQGYKLWVTIEKIRPDGIVIKVLSKKMHFQFSFISQHYLNLYKVIDTPVNETFESFMYCLNFNA